jgi:mannose-6-phosphate isomerase-like protein (cupin superfamily)
MKMLRDFNIEDLPLEHDHIAPDGSEIRSPFSMKHGTVCHCRLPADRVSLAHHHKTVEEFWYVIKGQGQVWRKLDKSELITDISPGKYLNIPVGTHFQFRNTGSEPLEIMIFTMPPWPGPSEAVDVEGVWKPTSANNG